MFYEKYDLGVKNTTRDLKNTTWDLKNTTRDLENTTQAQNAWFYYIKRTIKNTTRKLKNTTQNLENTTRDLKNTTRGLENTTRKFEFPASLRQKVTKNSLEKGRAVSPYPALFGVCEPRFVRFGPLGFA